MVLLVGIWSVIVTFLGHTHLLLKRTAAVLIFVAEEYLHPSAQSVECVSYLLLKRNIIKQGKHYLSHYKKPCVQW